MNIREKLQQEHPDAELLFMTEEEFDEAIIRVASHKDPHTKKMVKAVAYDRDKVILVNESMGMTYDEAVEYFDFNQEGAYMGENTPIFV